MSKREIGKNGIKNDILKYCRSRGGWWRAMPVSPYGNSGFPDILGVWDGYAIFIEAKTPDGKTRPDQAITIAQITRQGGGLAFVASSVEEVKNVLNTFLTIQTR